MEWVPLEEALSQQEGQRSLLSKIVKQKPITYCVDTEFSSEVYSANTFVLSSRGFFEKDKNYDTTEVENILQRWFQNVLKRAKKNPQFYTEFADIIPILKNPVKMKKVACGPHPKEYLFSDFITQRKGYLLNKEIEDLRIVFSSFEKTKQFTKQNGYSEDYEGFYTSLSDRKLIWISKKDSLSERVFLLHEFGHLLGFADILYNEDRQAKEYGSSSKKTIMAQSFSLTCDDADGLVAMIYLALNKDKTFTSFCDKNLIYHNGKRLPLPTLEKKDFIEFDNKIKKNF